MHTRCFGVGLAGLLTAMVAGTGCGRSEPVPASRPAQNPPAPPRAAASPAEVIARVRWAGTKQIAAHTNGTTLKGIWAISESAKLQSQTLDKLARAPWMLPDRKPDPKAAALLRPLLEDVLHEECYLEVRQATNQPGQLAFAIRLDDGRAALWETSLAAVLESLTGIRPTPAAANPHAWSLKKHHAPNLLELVRAGQWTILGAAQDENPLLDEIVSRIGRQHAPFEPDLTNGWFEAVLDPARLPGALSAGGPPLGDWPKISVSVAGEGTNLHTRARLNFAKPPTIGIEPWNIPISIMDGPMTSFTAVRGFKAWLGSVKAWNDLQIGAPPNQLYFWALLGLGMNSYGAAPLPDASNAVHRLTDLVLRKGDPWSGTNDNYKFIRSEFFNGLDWQGVPWVVPSLRSLELTNGSFILGALFQNLATSPPPPEYFDKALGETNLVYYDWEETDPRTAQWLYVGQFVRFVTLKPQMPFQCAALNWLKAIGPKLNLSVTRIQQTAPDQLSIDRTSTIGFTGIELHLLADWLESPQFPVGLHTLRAPPD